MTTLLHRTLLLAAATAALGSAVRAAAAGADVPPPEKRRVIVDLAEHLARPAGPAPLAAGLVQPFNPVAFGQPDPEELRAIANAQAAANAANAQAKPSTDRDLLNAIAVRITPSGIMILGGEPRLIFAQKRLRIGDALTVSYDGHDYTLELTAIDRTTYTLRLNRDEITRPIKPGKTP